MPSTPVVVLDSTLTDIADAIRGKNGSSDTYKPSEMPAAITAIPSGGGGGITREVDANGTFQFPAESFVFSLPSNARDIGARALANAFSQCSTLTSADLSSLTTVSGDSALTNAFSSCSSLASVDLSSLTTVSGTSAFYSAFSSCSSLASVDLSSLTTVSGQVSFNSAFSSCSSLASVDLSSLTTISGGNAFSSAFQYTSLASVNFDSLTTVSGENAMYSAFRQARLTSVSFPALSDVSGSYCFGEAFSGCFTLASVSFPALTTSSFGSRTDQFDKMLKSVTGCTVHFPAAIQSTIGSWASVTNGFGGTNTTVLFDL